MSTDPLVPPIGPQSTFPTHPLTFGAPLALENLTSIILLHPFVFIPVSRGVHSDTFRLGYLLSSERLNFHIREITLDQRISNA